ncbi:MAG: DUF1491 family protein [Pacificimonas sp.]
MWIDAIRRQVAADGGFAMVLAKGDEIAGAVILVMRTRDNLVSAYARTNMGDGQVEWRALMENEAESSGKLHEALEKQRRFDPDLWLIELDIADPARFIAELPQMS